MSSPRLRIGIELRQTPAPLTGIGNYQLRLLHALTAHDSGLEYSAFDRLGWSPVSADDFRAYAQRQDEQPPARGASSAAPLALQARAYKMLAGSDLARSALRSARAMSFSRSIRRQSLDLFHAFHFMPPGDPSVTALPIIYDLSAVRFPDAHPAERLRWLEKLPATLARTPLVQTISLFARDEIVSTYGVPQERIVVAPPAATALFKPLGIDVTRRDLTSFDLHPGAYLLAVGTLEPRKNLRTLIAAYGALSKDERLRMPLAIAGGAGWGKLDLPHATDALVQEGSLRFLGAVSNTQLRSLYEGAAALLFPSLYEGFGMPMVEAMSCGTAVVHSSDTSMSEIGGGLALEVPATDVKAWTDAIRQVRDGALRNEPESRAARVRQAATYSWDASAHTVRAAYRTLTGR